jgi:8-oxo-dGTP diphosphatase
MAAVHRPAADVATAAKRRLITRVANLAMNLALKPDAVLPDLYLLTPAPSREAAVPAFLAHLEAVLQGGIRLVQLRAPLLGQADYARLFEQVRACCDRHHALLLANCAPDQALRLGAAGVHLSSARLMACTARPSRGLAWVSAACHDAAQLQQAQRLGVDFVTVSPVLPTATHPEAVPLGWAGFAELSALTTVPVFGLGGLAPGHLPQVKQAGGYGVAAIGGLWGR